MVIVYTPELPMAILNNQLEEGRIFSQSGNQYITNDMMISKGIAILNNTGVLPMTSRIGTANLIIKKHGLNLKSTFSRHTNN